MQPRLYSRRMSRNTQIRQLALQVLFLFDAQGAAEREGCGQGLALHSTLLAVVGGTLSVESEPGRYTRVLLCLPTEALNLGLKSATVI